MRESRPGVVQAMSLRRWERYILKKALAEMVGEREKEWYHGSKLSSLWGTKVFLYAGAACAFGKNKEVDL